MNKESLNLMHRLFPQAAADGGAVGFTNQFPAGLEPRPREARRGRLDRRDGSTTQ